MTAACPICGADAERFLVRERVPANQNVLFTSRDRARSAPTGTLSLHACPQCAFVFNAAFAEDRLDYGASYENTQTASDAFASYVDERVARVVDRCGPTLKTLIEVGCGKGVFLSRVIDATLATVGYGFDTSYEGAASAHDGRLRFFKHYFGAGYVADPIDAVLCRHVIEHIPDPVAFLVSIRQVLETVETRIFFETPCVDWVLRNQVIWDFFYEHCSYFNPRSLTQAFERAGFGVEAVSHVFGGQYLWLEGALGVAKRTFPSDGGAVVQQARVFAQAQSAAVDQWIERLTALHRNGPLAIWGAGAKGVTFAGLVDPNAALIDCVVDVNPRKQGCFIPGTGHPIVAPQDLAERKISAAVLMNPNYRRENEAMLATLGITIPLLT
jgi:SAM-dependent methyltransferase